MQLNEIKKVNSLAKGSSLEVAALKYLGLKEKAGSEAAVKSIVDEVFQWNKADAKTREGIIKYKSAKS